MSVDVVALLNDTTGTQLAVGFEDPNCHVGLILGTGTNACYMEKTANIPKFKGDSSKFPEVIVNCEWGAFGEGEAMDDWLTEYDDKLEQRFKEDHYKQQAEKKAEQGENAPTEEYKEKQQMCVNNIIMCDQFGILGSGRFEKLISGKYLGFITHATLLKLAQDKVLFGGIYSEKFSELVIDRFDSAFLSIIEGEK